MRKRKKARALVVNPIVIILPLVILLWFGWQQYVTDNRGLAQSNSNILSGSTFTLLKSNGIPQNWQIKNQGALSYKVSQTNGYVSGKSLKLSVSGYKSGDLELVTPKISVAKNTSYLFKGFYSSNIGFNLFVRYYYEDGQSSLELLQKYPAEKGSWTTDSTAFNTGNTIVGTQIIYSITSDGYLTLNGLFLTPSNAVYTDPAPNALTNLIPNSDLSSSKDHSPHDWLTYSVGSNSATFNYDQQGGTNYLHVSLSSYKNGEAKWQYQPLQVTPGRLYSFGVDYLSNSPSDVVAEFELSNHQREFDTLETLPPSGNWTHTTYQFDIPVKATNMFVGVVLHHNGSLDTRDYSLSNITKTNISPWNKPMVSIAFDNGWQSAYENSWSLLQSLNFPATFYINPGTIDTQGFVTDKDIDTIYSQGGELASGGYDNIDLTTLDSARLQAEMEKARTFLQQTFNENSTDFAPPNNKNDPQVQFYAQTIYSSSLGTTQGINTSQNFDPHNLRVFYISKNTSPSSLQSALNETKESNGWLILVYQKVAGIPQAGVSDVAQTTFKNQIDKIKASGIKVETVADVINYLGTMSQNSPHSKSNDCASTSKTNSDSCQPTKPSDSAPDLPNTGPGNIIELFSGATLSGAGMHRIYLHHRTLKSSKSAKT